MERFGETNSLSGEREQKKVLTEDIDTQRAKEIVAVNLLEAVRDDLYADPWKINLDDYGKYVEAAKLCLETDETDPKFKLDSKLKMIAQDIIEKEPTEAAA
ncbi:MAG TPA: hypothetical protein VJB67_00965 [Patescibacteria group bacterium]|nr:hypothetical protein [Patescibacteria group bacterium]